MSEDWTKDYHRVDEDGRSAKKGKPNIAGVAARLEALCADAATCNNHILLHGQDLRALRAAATILRWLDERFKNCKAMWKGAGNENR